MDMSLPFGGLLPPEKTAAIQRGERVEITGAESAAFTAQMDLLHERERIQLHADLKHLQDGIREHWQESTHGVTANMRLADAKLHALIGL